MSEITYFLLIIKEDSAAEQCKTHHILLNKIFIGRVEERLEELLLWTLYCDKFSLFRLKSTILAACFL